MNIADIYKWFRIPPSLQEHMLRVCAIVVFLEKHWAGAKVDWDFVKKLALLHDVGNIVKFDLDRYQSFLGDEQKNVERWKEIQKEIIAKYGADDHEATQKMLREIRVSEQTIRTILDKSFGKSVATAASNNWPLKILYYADFRVLPLRIGTLDERINDVRQRMPWYANRPDFDTLIKAAKDIESQIQKNMDVTVDDITDASITGDSRALKLELQE